jgi:hypothetical protein
VGSRGLPLGQIGVGQLVHACFVHSFIQGNDLQKEGVVFRALSFS